MRKSSAKKIPDKPGKKAAEENKPVSKTAESVAAGKKKVRQVKSENANKKGPKVKIKVGGVPAVKAEKKSPLSSIKGKEKTGKTSGKPASKRKITVSPTASTKKTADKKAAVKSSRKAAAKLSKKPAARSKKKIEKPEKSAKKISAPVRRKKQVRIVEDAKVTKPAGKRRIKAEPEVEKAAKKFAPEIAKEPETKKFAEVFREGTKRELKKKVPETVVQGQPVEWRGLPSGYGENDITLMPVGPQKLFAFWEVREGAIEKYGQGLTIRVYDAAGIAAEHIESGTYFDIPVYERIGGQYIEVSPRKEFIADIGIAYKGIFITISRSRRVSTPHSGVSAERDSLKGYDRAGQRFGYE